MMPCFYGIVDYVRTLFCLWFRFLWDCMYFVLTFVERACRHTTAMI